MSHILRLEVFFSVHGEDVCGGKLNDGGPGELRVMRVDKKVVVPAVRWRWPADMSLLLTSSAS